MHFKNYFTSLHILCFLFSAPMDTQPCSSYLTDLASSGELSFHPLLFASVQNSGPYISKSFERGTHFRLGAYILL